MEMQQFEQWVQAYSKHHHQAPKVFVIGCSGLPHYLLAVEFKHHLEPVRQGDKPIHYVSLEGVREELMRLGVDKAFLRLHNTYDECCGNETLAESFCDIEMAVMSAH